MVTLLDAVVLATIQGVTEWPPISSSGHLVIFQELRWIQVPACACGLTSYVGLLSGIRRELVFLYTLLLSIPILTGTMIFESQGTPSTILGFEVMIPRIAVTTVVGYFTIGLLKTIRDKKSSYLWSFCYLAS
jgi:undecaprenyl pyrophosphate phosphatase UppP